MDFMEIIKTIERNKKSRKMSSLSLESGYESNEEFQFCPNPNFSKIDLDVKRLGREYEIRDLIMESANGMIYSGKSRKTGKSVILKQIPRSKVTKWSRMESDWVPSEIYYHFKAAENDIDGVIACPISWFEKKSSFVLVMEKVSHCIDIFELVKQHGALGEQAAGKIFGQILKMFSILKKSGISHRDFKDENIIINVKTLEAKLIDFGCACQDLEGEEVEFSGTPEFYPPEFWRKRSYHHDKLNLWGIGLILYIMTHANLPFQHIDQIRPKLEIEIDPSLDSNLILLLKGLLDSNPTTRFDFDKIQTYFDLWSNSM